MSELETARLIEWVPGKSFGYLLLESRRVFLHRNDLARGYLRPKPGDLVRFTLGVDELGRVCAKNAFPLGNRVAEVPEPRSSRAHRLHPDTVGFLLILLFAPVWAVYRLDFHRDLAAILAVALSGITFLTYLLDKGRAKSGDWRIPEATLHLLSSMGGWPGAFLGQQFSRHKTAKVSFQSVFWLTVLVYEFAAIDFLLHWKISRATAALVWSYLGK
ncbi:MAG: DUF1294 domain-containing protein [Chthoniobacterales bacterium]